MQAPVSHCDLPALIRRVMGCLVALLAAPAWAALSLGSTTVSVPAGSYTVVKVTGAQGAIQVDSSRPDIAAAAPSARNGAAAGLNVMGRTEGTVVLRVHDANSVAELRVAVTPPTLLGVAPASVVIARDATTTLRAVRAAGALSVSSSNPGVVTAAISGGAVTVRGLAAGTAVVSVKDGNTVVNVPVTVTAPMPSATADRYTVIAWNDLGMHCVDGKDYSIFSILPPFNNLHAQVVNATTGKVVTSGVTLSYEAVADPTGSINTTSAGKTNFWTWAQPLYGASPPVNVGLTGNATPSTTPRPMTLETVNGWFEATGLPITPYDDSGAKNYYPTVKVTARNSAGVVLATTTAVLPVSDEMTCAACHASRATTVTNTAQQAARPAAGWVFDANPETDWKKNILRLHDEKQAGSRMYRKAKELTGLNSGLYLSALAGTPTLCAACHASNALPGTGIAGITPLTTALHRNHSHVVDPSTMATLDSANNRTACYMCHPGSETRCLRGAMGNAVDASGNSLMSCQSCHGKMADVGASGRVGWLQQPTCQACHFDGKRTLTALDASGHLVQPADTRFATNANTPATGFNLFRFSKGHGGMQCESCHGATHAEYPSSHQNDNLQSIALQGYAGTVRECTVCHASLPLSTAGGPHGMHSIGQSWVNGHGNRVESGGSAQCAYCHGANYRGTALAQVKVARTYTTERGTRTFAAGQNVGCYDCHNGPNP